MTIQSNVIAWFSDVVVTIYHCDDEQSLFDQLIQSLSGQFHPLSVVVELCCTIGLSKEIADMFGPASNALVSNKAHLSARSSFKVSLLPWFAAKNP
jgi:hypothetical protein